MFNCECGTELIQENCETILDVCQEAPVVKDYETLANKPQINGVTLDGNKTSEDLGITQEIADAVSAEATLRENADTALGGRIDNEATARENADTALGGRIDGEITNRTNADNALGTRIDNEILARQGGDNNLQTQIDAITSKSDVVDVVANYAALQAYDTSSLGNNDVIKVLDDETHDDAQTYYRWNKTAGTWSYIGSEAPYYSKGQMDTMLQAKQDKLIAGTNIQIAQDGKTISATDTTYTAGNGLNLNGTEFSADTTVLATKSDLDNYYTKTETDTKLAPKLEAEVVAELPSTGTDGKLYLTPKNYTTGTATGNPITISLGEDAGQITSFQLDGDTYQQSYEGKNLLQLNDGTTTLGGVPITTTNGTVNLNGTATSGGQGYYVSINITASEPMVFSTNKSGATSGLDVKLQYKRGATTYYPTVGTSLSLQAGDIIQQMYLIVSNGSVLDGSFSPMLEAGSSATSFEPYVGGQASPNPDYPQPIQTVTGEQTVTVVGKNLFNSNLTMVQGFVGNDGAINPSSTTSIMANEYIPVAENTDYIFSWTEVTTGSSVRNIAFYDSSKTFISRVQNNPTASPYTITTPAGCAYIMFNFYNANGMSASNSLSSYLTDIQLELGSTATAYAPYHATSYPLDLGNIQLCKLGTYQDYIYKDGDDWKVHKAIDSMLFSEADFFAGQIGTTGHYRMTSLAVQSTAVLPPDNSTVGIIFSNAFVTKTVNNTYNRIQGIALQATGTTKGAVYVYADEYDENTASNFNEKMAQIGAKFYYALLNPTDTTITDQTLIAQLEAVRTASLQASNTITNTATGTNLAGDMELGYYEFDPTNRYDKWLWLDLNNNYEKLGS